MYLWIDMFTILPLAILMSRTEPYPELHPGRPLTQLFSVPIFVSVIGTALLQVGSVAGAYFWLRTQRWFVPLDPNPNSENYLCYETTVVFLVNSFQYIFVNMAFNMSYKFRRVWLTNWMLVVSIVILFAGTAAMDMVPWAFFQVHIFVAMAVPFTFRWQLLLYALGNGAVTILFEYLALGCGCARVVRSCVRRLACCARCRHTPKRFRRYRAPWREAV